MNWNMFDLIVMEAIKCLLGLWLDRKENVNI